MTAIVHYDYESEHEKLNYVLQYVRDYYKGITSEKDRIDKAVEYGLTHFNSDNAEQFNDLIMNTTLQDNLSQKIKNLNKSLTKPYFARVDFVEHDDNKLQKLYIGKISLLREKDNEPIVIDWRAPIANLYYEGRLGKSSYICPEGEIDGEIRLKRQYIIEAAQLNEIYDIDITTNDDFLQACLASSKDKRLKDIVSTIQSEQNKVIRADMWKPLIVQGAAGGGKTTIALHRIAFLLYEHEKTLSPKNFMIIAPNRFFLSYISEVLPDLGVENVIQTTFEDFALEIIGHKFKIKPPHEKISDLINNSNEQFKSISTFKSSLEYKNAIDMFIKTVENNFIPKTDFKICNFVLFTYDELRILFLEEYSHLPFKKRVLEIKKHLTNVLKQRKMPILEEVGRNFDRKINEVRSSMKDSEKRRKLIIELAEARDTLIEKIKKESKTLIRDYIAQITVRTPFEYYKEFIDEGNKYINTVDREVINYTEKLISTGVAEVEDLAPIMYIKYRICGLDDKISARHVVIDEAQDFSLFQLFVLRKIVGGRSFTILGDLCQGIHSYRGINDWDDVAKYIFDDDASQLTLEQSYRTTVEIMDKANAVIKFLNNPKLPAAKPVLRHGEPVTIREKTSLTEIAEEIHAKISSFSTEGFKSAAIICKTLDECNALKSQLNLLKTKVKVITGNEKDFSGGLVIIPSYLVKGLEFDVVFIANASRERYTMDELDIKLLYVAMTRPLHRLHIYSIGQKTELLS